MSPEAHLFASWLIAAGTTRNRRDLRLVALADIAPDLDGLGIVADGLNALAGRQSFLYQNRVIGVCLLAVALWIGAGRGETVVGVFSRRLDNVVAPVLKRWRTAVRRLVERKTVSESEPWN